MSLLSLALAYIRHRRLVSLVTVASLGLGIGLVLVVLNVRRNMERNFLQQAGQYDLVVGPTGSETALVLTGLFLAETPRGNLTYETYQAIAGRPGVLGAYPLCFGDYFSGTPVVGTTSSFLTRQTRNGPVFTLRHGRVFEAPKEAVFGADVAARCGLSVGDTLTTSHGPAGGEDHTDFVYTVVGILAPTQTAFDRATFVDMVSYWWVHDHGHEDEEESGRPHEHRHDPNAPPPTEGEVTLMLLRVQKPLLFTLQRGINQDHPGALCVRPGDVLQTVFRQVLQPVERLLVTYGLAVVAVAVGGVLSTLLLVNLARRRELALLRVLGASPLEIVGLVLLEAWVQLIVGAALGLVCSRLLTASLAGDLQDRFGLRLPIFDFQPAEFIVLAAVLGIGVLVSLFPAWLAYRRDLVESLGRE